ncbi:MAG: phage tail tube protein [Planctomycetaceae bacterium]
MGAEATMGWEFKLAMEPGAAPHVFDVSSEPYPFLSESLGMSEEHLDGNGARGTRSAYANRVRSGNQTVGGGIVLNVTPGMLTSLLPRILGSASVGTLAETLPAFGVMIDRASKVFTYSDCLINRATFRASAGGLLELELDIFGLTETVAAKGSFPALTITETVADQPLTFMDGVYELPSTLEVTGFELVIDNAVARRFANSTTATALTPGDRIVTTRLTTPWNDTNASLYADGIAGVVGQYTLTNDDVSLVIDLPSVQIPRQTPVYSARNGETFLTLAGACRRTTTDAEVSMTLDATTV